MIDFQGLHARQLAVYREYAESCRRTKLQMTRTFMKLDHIRSMTVTGQNLIRQRTGFISADSLGQRVNLWG